MDIKSLMIGDWVYNKHHGKNIRLTPYDFFTHTHNEFGGQRLVPYATPTIGLDLEPIPLTPQILEKNGFVYTSEDKLFEDIYPRISMLYAQYRLIENGSINYGEMSEIKYVHQLQHALRLCGISKEIDL